MKVQRHDGLDFVFQDCGPQMMTIDAISCEIGIGSKGSLIQFFSIPRMPSASMFKFHNWKFQRKF
jgi:hypothetical protein